LTLQNISARISYGLFVAYDMERFQRPESYPITYTPLEGEVSFDNEVNWNDLTLQQNLTLDSIQNLYTSDIGLGNGINVFNDWINKIRFTESKVFILLPMKNNYALIHKKGVKFWFKFKETITSGEEQHFFISNYGDEIIHEVDDPRNYNIWMFPENDLEVTSFENLIEELKTIEY